MMSHLKKYAALVIQSRVLWMRSMENKRYSFNLTRYYSSEETESNITKTSVIFSGIQPTGVIHLGNYLGAVRQWVDLQENCNPIYSIVDLHSITLPYDHKTLPNSILTMAATLIACGIDPSKSILYQQSKVLEHSSLCWVLTCLTTIPQLNRFPQFKEKSAVFKNKSVPTGLFLYPALQTADILLYKTTHVPVGEDQYAHINLAADLANLFNNKYGKTFPIPKAIKAPDTIARIKSLRNPSSKMSKSEQDKRSRIELLDSPSEIREIIKKSVTDCTSEVYFDPINRPGVSNLMTIHHALTEKSYETIRKDCEHIDTGKYKLLLADVIIEYLKPIRLKTLQLLNEKQYLISILNQGSDKASERAKHTLEVVYKKIGI